MGNCCGKLFSKQHNNGKLIKELFDIVTKSMSVWIGLMALKLTSIGLIALKYIEKDFFANYYALIFVFAIMLFFLCMMFYPVLLDESERTNATILPITLIYLTACAVSTVAVIFISVSPILVVVNLVLWGAVIIATLFIYCQKKQSLDAAKDGSELLLTSIIAMNGDGNAPEQPVMGQPATQQMTVSGSGEELKMTGFNSNCDEQFREGDGEGSVET